MKTLQIIEEFTKASTWPWKKGKDGVKALTKLLFLLDKDFSDI